MVIKFELSHYKQTLTFSSNNLMSNKQPLLFLIITLLTTASRSYPTCQAIEIDEYQYDLTQLPTSDIFKL